MIMRDTITGNDRPGAVASMFAMDEDRFGQRIDQGKDLRDLFVGGTPHAGQRHIRVNNAGRVRVRFFICRSFLRNSQVDDGFDAKPLQVLNGGRVRLSASKKKFVHPAKIGDAFGWRQSARARKANSQPEDQAGRQK